MKIAGFTMLTDPNYRQDLWMESIRQALEVFDEVVIIYGREKDKELLESVFGNKKLSISWYFLEWPQPEWSYEELPRHLNLGLQYCYGYMADWAVLFSMDYFFHEKDKGKIHAKLAAFKRDKIMIGSFEKLQFFKVNRAYEKGNVPIALNLSFDFQYGVNESRYTDLCYPIIPSGKTVKYHSGKYDTPVGAPIPRDRMRATGIHVWNYDYSFKTEERAKELLYHFDRAHAKWFGAGYYGDKIEDITMESAFRHYIKLVTGRIKKCYKVFKTEDHPKHIQNRVRNIKSNEFGYNLWDKIKITER